MGWTQQQLDSLLSRNKSVSVAHDKDGAAGLCATKPECTERLPLDSAGKREGKSCQRFKIVFTVYARRPLDWDNYRLKDLQDCIVKSGILDGDEWNVLEGSVISKKAHSEAEEKTVVEIITCNNPSV